MRRYPQSRFSSGQSHDQGFESRRGARPARSAVAAAVVLLSDQPAMPGQQRLGGDDRGHFGQDLPPQPLGLGGQATALVVVESKALVAELLAKNPVLLAQGSQSPAVGVGSSSRQRRSAGSGMGPGSLTSGRSHYRRRQGSSPAVSDRSSFRAIVRPAKAGMFSGRQSHRGKSQEPRSLGCIRGGNEADEAN